MKNQKILRSYVLTLLRSYGLLLILSYGVVYGQHNAACYAAWKNEKDAVVKFMNVYGSWNSGALVNTTTGENNNRRFLLTSFFGTPKNSQVLSNLKFYWHYESPKCNPSVVPGTITTTGAKVVAQNVRSNFALLELLENPEEAWDVTPYYLGWDHSGSAVTGATLIYHSSQGGIKKIIGVNSTVTPLESDYCNHEEFEYWGIKNGDLWEIDPGYGAPLLNFNHKIIGYYDYGYCDDGYCHSYYYFNRFAMAWEGKVLPGCSSDSTKRLKDWLDPLNTDSMSIAGRRPCQKTIRLWHSLPREEYHAKDSIISKQEIANGDSVSYKAGLEIVLMCDKDNNRGSDEGFHAKLGSNFHAQIEELLCNGPQFSASSSQGDETHNSSLSKPLYEFSLFPNPNFGSFHIESNFPLSEIARLSITNLLGVSVYETQKVSSNGIQLQNAPAGIYFVVMVLKNGNVLTQKMMVR